MGPQGPRGYQGSSRRPWPADIQFVNNLVQHSSGYQVREVLVAIARHVVRISYIRDALVCEAGNFVEDGTATATKGFSVFCSQKKVFGAFYDLTHLLRAQQANLEFRGRVGADNNYEHRLTIGPAMNFKPAHSFLG